jgi:hypothetical protein
MKSSNPQRTAEAVPSAVDAAAVVAGAAVEVAAAAGAAEVSRDETENDKHRLGKTLCVE